MFRKFVTDVSNFVTLNFKVLAVKPIDSGVLTKNPFGGSTEELVNHILDVEPLKLGHCTNISDKYVNKTSPGIQDNIRQVFTYSVGKKKESSLNLTFKVLGFSGHQTSELSNDLNKRFLQLGSDEGVKTSNTYNLPLFDLYTPKSPETTKDPTSFEALALEFDNPEMRDLMTTATIEGVECKFEISSGSRQFILWATPIDAILTLQFCAIFYAKAGPQESEKDILDAVGFVWSVTDETLYNVTQHMNADRLSFAINATFLPRKKSSKDEGYGVQRRRVLTERVALETANQYLQMRSRLRSFELYVNGNIQTGPLMLLIKSLNDMIDELTQPSAHGSSVVPAKKEVLTAEMVSILLALGGLKTALGEGKVDDKVDTKEVQRLVHKAATLNDALNQIKGYVKAPDGADAAAIAKQVQTVATKAQNGYQDGQVAELRGQLEKADQVQQETVKQLEKIQVVATRFAAQKMELENRVVELRNALTTEEVDQVKALTMEAAAQQAGVEFDEMQAGAVFSVALQESLQKLQDTIQVQLESILAQDHGALHDLSTELHGKLVEFQRIIGEPKSNVAAVLAGFQTDPENLRESFEGLITFQTDVLASVHRLIAEQVQAAKLKAETEQNERQLGQIKALLANVPEPTRQQLNIKVHELTSVEQATAAVECLIVFYEDQAAELIREEEERCQVIKGLETAVVGALKTLDNDYDATEKELADLIADLGSKLEQRIEAMQALELMNQALTNEMADLTARLAALEVEKKKLKQVEIKLQLLLEIKKVP